MAHVDKVEWDSLTVGSLPPRGYVAWHEWAARQYGAGLRQRPCPACGRWGFPQEFAGDGEHADRRCLAALKKGGE